METYRFFSYAWHIDENEEETTNIRVYGLDQENENVCIRINDFTPYVYIELPIRVSWNDSNAKILVGKISEMMKDSQPVSSQLVHMKKLYGAHIDKNKKQKLFPYLFCSFNNKKDIMTAERCIRKQIHISGMGPLRLKMHEQDADPILQLTCFQNLPTAGWIDFRGHRVDNDSKITQCNHEFMVRWKNIVQHTKDEVAKPLIMGFDIEVNSSNPAKMPAAHIPGDKIFQISCIFANEGDKVENYRSFLLTLGSPDQDIVGANVTIYTYESEGSLLEGFTNLVNTENPNIISGYNILGFDIPYMIDRAKHNFCVSEFDRLGFHKFYHAQEKTIKWSSAAYKNQEFQYLDAEGRVFVDLLPLVKRDYKMDNYRLKTVSEYFLGKEHTKDPLSVKGIFKCYRLGITRNADMTYGKQAKRAMGIVGKYCIQDSVLVVQLMEKLQTWIGLCEMAKTCGVPIFTLYTQGQQIKVYSQVYKFCMANGMVVEKDGYITEESDRYVGAHVFDPIPGCYDVVIPFDFASLYPSTIIAYNIDYSTWVTDPSVPDSDCHVMDWHDHVGCSHDPKVVKRVKLTQYIDGERAKIKALRTKRDLITVKSFPGKHIAVARKLKDKTKEQINKKINILTYALKPSIKDRSDITKPKFPMCEHRHYRFLKEPKGVIPTILQNLLNARKNTRKQIKELKQKVSTVTDEVDRANTLSLTNVLDKRQLSYKVSANSMYGAMGVRRGYLPFMPGAMCTTYMGRVNIELAAKELVDTYKGELIYGDTDSCYIHFPHLKTAEETWDYAEHVSREISKIYPSPLVLEFEEVIYWRFFILTKKRYMYTSCYRDGVVNHNVGKKGVLLARRDNSMFVRNIYEKVIEMVFDRRNRDDVLYFIILELNKLCARVFPHKDFVVTKSIGNSGGLNLDIITDDNGKRKGMVGDYTVPILPSDPDSRIEKMKQKNANSITEYYLKCLPAQVQLAEKMKRRGQQADAGSRLEYVITEGTGHTAKQYEKVECAEYFALHADVIKIDYMYYLKLLTNPMDQVLNVVYGKDKDFQKDMTLNQYNYRQKVVTKMHNELKSMFAPKIQFVQ
jgi:DNA polymerase elongation subunit (family B)